MRGGSSPYVNASLLDGMDTTRARSIISNSTIYSVSCLEGSLAYAVEVDGTVFKSVDGVWRYDHSLGYIGASSIAVCGEDVVYAGGDSGAIHYYNGEAWKAVPWDGDNLLMGSDCSPDDEAAYISGDNVVLRLHGGAIEKVWQFKDADFRALQALEDGCVLAVGLEGAFWIYNGTTWADHSTPDLLDFTGVWAENCHRAFIVSTSGHAFEYRDGALRRMADSPGFIIGGIWGTSCNDLYACGFNGTVSHYDGKSWEQMDTGTSIWLESISGSGSDNIYFAGGYGTILRYNGTVFLRVHIETPFKIDK